MKPVLAPCFAALTVLALSSSASAFCRTTTKERPAGMCPEACITEGDPLYWGENDPLFIMNERGFPDLADSIATQTISRSFDHWNEVDCNGKPIGLDIRAASGTTDLNVGPVADEPNANVVVYFTREEWERGGEEEECADRPGTDPCIPLPDSAYALTAIWYNKANGEILGADMHFNGGMGKLVNCADTGCAGGEIDLENVATHEAGHFIGLAHSDVKRSTMFCSAEPNEVEKRSLAADDVAGACAIYADGFQGGGSGGGGNTKKGCAVSHGTQASGLSGLWLLLAVLGLRRRTARLMK